MTTTTRTNPNGQPRMSLASQLDRLDNILDSLDTALSGAVQEAVEMAVKQAVQSVLTEVLTNRELQDQLRQVAQSSDSGEDKSGNNKSRMGRLWSATKGRLQQTVQMVQKAGHGVGMALLAAGGVIAGGIYAARKRIASAASVVSSQGKTLLAKAGTVLGRLVPTFALCGT